MALERCSSCSAGLQEWPEATLGPSFCVGHLWGGLEAWSPHRLSGAHPKGAVSCKWGNLGLHLALCSSVTAVKLHMRLQGEAMGGAGFIPCFLNAFPSQQLVSLLKDLSWPNEAKETGKGKGPGRQHGPSIECPAPCTDVPGPTTFLLLCSGTW